MRPEPGYNDRELERGRRIRDEIRKGDYCPDCHYKGGLHAHGCPSSPALEDNDV